MQVAVVCAGPEEAGGSPRSAEELVELLWPATRGALDGNPDFVFVGTPPGHDLKGLTHEISLRSPWVRMMGATCATAGPATILAVRDPAGAYGVAGAAISADVKATTRILTDQALNDAGRPGEQPDLVWIWAHPEHLDDACAGALPLVGASTPLVASPTTAGERARLLAGQRIWGAGVLVGVWFWSSPPRAQLVDQPPEGIARMLSSLARPDEPEGTPSRRWLEAVAPLVAATPGPGLDHALIQASTHLTGATGAALLVPGERGSLMVHATSVERLRGLSWSPEELLTRVLNGHPALAFDVRKVPEWRALPRVAREGVRSALHLPIVGLGGEVDRVLMLVHPEQGYFSKRQLPALREIIALCPASKPLVAPPTPPPEAESGLARHSPALLWSVNRYGQLTEFNRAFFNHSLEWLGIIPQQGEGAAPDWAGRYLEAREAPVQLELVREIAGEARFFEVSLKGVGALVMGCAYDITEHVHARQSLDEARETAEQASESKSGFLAMVSHEIRTPLNAIMGMVDLTLGTDLSDEQREYIVSLKSNAESLTGLINDVLDFSKIDAGQMALDRAPVDIGALVADAVSALSRRALDKGLDLRCAIAPEVPHQILGDSQRIRQILFNLVGNAIKYTEAGQVIVALEVVGRCPDIARLRLVVKDTGHGISETERVRIFERFYQGRAGRWLGEGSGLGLTITRTLVELMGGRLSVESERGEGSTFTVDLTLEVVTWADSVLESLRAGLSGARILCADVGERICKPLRPYLEPHGVVCQRLLSIMGAEHTMAGRGWDALIIDGGFAEAEALVSLARRTQPGVSILVVAPLGIPVGSWAHDLRRVPYPLYGRRLVEALAQTISKERDVVTPRPAMGGAAQGRGRHILLVEDNPDGQVVVSRILAKEGHTVEVAHNGEIAIRKALSGTFDLILMDVHLPGMDGIEATRQIRQRSAEMGRPEVPIIAVTAHATEQFRQACLDAGMDDFAVKPMRRPALIELVEQARWPRVEGTPEGDRSDDVVYVDPDTLDLIPRFLSARRRDLDTIHEALSTGDLDRVRVIGHQMKGTGSAYGFPRITDIGRSLEEAARGGEAAQIPTLAGALRAYLDRIRVEPEE